MTNINIRTATAADIGALDKIAVAMKQTHEENYFERCLAEQDAGNRLVLLAIADAPVGYVQLNFKPLYPPFRRFNMPEVQDLNVVPDARQQGIGAALVEYCEQEVKRRGGTDIAISVGLYPRYGAAQRLYVQRGYVPDGAGACYDDVPVKNGELRPIDDLLTLKLVKSL